MPRPPLLGEVASSVSEDDGEVIQSGDVYKRQRFDVCSVVVGMAAEKYESEADLADELKLPDPYVAVRLNKLA